MDGGYTCVLDTNFVWSLSAIVRWIASQPECLSILTLNFANHNSLTSIPSLASPHQLNCHRDVSNPSLPRFLNPRPLRHHPGLYLLLVLVIVPPCTPPVCSWRGILIHVFPSTLISSTYVPCFRSLPIPDLLQCYHLLSTLPSPYCGVSWPLKTKPSK